MPGILFMALRAAAPAAGPGPAKREIRLAERMAADELRRLAKDLPGTFDLVDIRPADQFKDYHIPGSRNADIAEVLNNPAYLTGVGPLILVDRDGSLAMQIAGILSQKHRGPSRPCTAAWRPFGRTPAGRIQAGRPWRRLSLALPVAPCATWRAQGRTAQGSQTEICGVLIMKESTGTQTVHESLPGRGDSRLDAPGILSRARSRPRSVLRHCTNRSLSRKLACLFPRGLQRVLRGLGKGTLNYYLVFMFFGVFAGGLILCGHGAKVEIPGRARPKGVQTISSCAGLGRRRAGRFCEPIGPGLHLGTSPVRKRHAALPAAWCF